MKSKLLPLTVLYLTLLSLPAIATTYYVDINSPAPTPPYTSWSTAATNIQDAIAQTANGDLILVNPGVYEPINVTNAITIQSANGPAATWVSGSNAMRCVYLTTNASLLVSR